MTSPTEHFALLFSVRRSIRYHSKRQGFYEGLDRLTNFMLLLLGSGIVATVVEGHEAWTLAVGFAVAGIAGLKLVYALGDNAARHARFVLEFSYLEHRLVEDDSDETVAAVNRDRLIIESSEPPVMRVLDTICHNDLLVAMDLDDEAQRVRLTWFQRLTAHLFRHGNLRLAKG